MSNVSTTTPAAVEATAVPAAPTGSELQIPAFEAEDFTPYEFLPRHYDLITRDSTGSEKLASSGVAPLIAVARGYRLVNGGKEGLKVASEAFGLPTSSQGYKDLAASVRNGHSMFMPWFGAAKLTAALAEGIEPKWTSWQARPNKPLPGKDSGSAKYKNATGGGTVLDVHPATPLNWTTGTAPRIIAEGLLKADSTLTAMLVAAGVPVVKLMHQASGMPTRARAILSEIMESIPAEKRWLIVGLVGVGTWHKNAEDWNSISVRDCRVIVAFDGDTKTNRQVNLQARDLGRFLETRGATSVEYATVPMVDGDPKTGLDDFFASGRPFSELDLMLGELPPTPAPKIRTEGVLLPVSDFAEAITYTIRNVDVDGETQKRHSVQVEAAVRVTSVVGRKSTYEGVPVERMISGSVAWLEHFAGSTTRKELTFSNKPLSLLENANLSAGTIVSKLTDGLATGVLVSPKADRGVQAAWLATVQDGGEKSISIDTSGLYTSDSGQLGFLTNRGLLTSRGIDPSAKASTYTEPIELDYIEVTPDNAKRISDAWDLLEESRGEIHKAHAGIFDLIVGMAVSASLGLQPKGAFLLFTHARAGKSSLMCMMNGWLGPSWHKAPTIMVQGSTPALLNEKLRTVSGSLVTIDDGMDQGTASGQTSKEFEAIRLFMSGAIRAGYEPTAMAEKMRAVEGGGHKMPKRTIKQVLGVIVAGESLDQMNFAGSTKDRAISVQTTKEEPLLANHGTIVPMTTRLRESGAQSTLLSAVLVDTLKNFEDDVDQAASMEAFMAKSEIAAREALAEAHPDIDGRSLELMAPVLVGLNLLIRPVAIAKEMLAGMSLDDGRDYVAESETVQGLWDESIERLYELWKRHAAGLEKSDTAGHIRVARALADALTSRKARLATSGAPWKPRDGYPFDRPEGELIGLKRDKDGDIVLMPSAVQDFVSNKLRMQGFENLAALRAALAPLIKDYKHPERIEGSGPVKRWRIDAKLWAEALGEVDDSETGTGAEVAEVVSIFTESKAEKPAKSPAMGMASGW